MIKKLQITQESTQNAHLYKITLNKQWTVFQSLIFFIFTICFIQIKNMAESFAQQIPLIISKNTLKIERTKSYLFLNLINRFTETPNAF